MGGCFRDGHTANFVILRNCFEVTCLLAVIDAVNQRTPFRSVFIDVIRRQFHLCPVFTILRLTDIRKRTFCFIVAWAFVSIAIMFPFIL